MRNFINLLESLEKTYYHGSYKTFPVGFQLTPQSDGYVMGSGMDEIERAAHHMCEALIEQYRPAGAPKRTASVYLVTDPDEIDAAGGYSDNVYVVEPNGPVWKANLHWYSELYNVCFDDEPDEDAERLANNYWNALPSGNNTLYEYLCPSATITGYE